MKRYFNGKEIKIIDYMERMVIDGKVNPIVLVEEIETGDEIECLFDELTPK